MPRPWLLAAAALLAACSTQTASCAPCPGPGFVELGLPETGSPAVIRTCVADEPCHTTKVSRAPQPKSLELVELAHPGRGWERYDGKLITVTVRMDGRRWRGSAGLVYDSGGDGTCACGGLAAQVLFTPVG